MQMLSIVSSAALLAIGLAATIPVNQSSAEEPRRGGEYTVLFKDDFDSMDPAIGYTFQSWSPIRAVFDGLMDYKPGTTELVPDLAESYEISPDGLTYTFKLRDGVRFHNGRVMTSADVKYSIERVANPATQSPGAGYFASIEGYQEYADGKAKDIVGITTPDEHQVKFTLSAPNATMLSVFGLNFGFVVPKEEVEKYGPDFTHHGVGTGAFKLTEYTPGQRIVLERFEDGWNKDKGFADKAIIQFGIEPVVQVLKVQNGEADITGDIFPPAKFLAVSKDENLKDRFITAEQLNTNYLAMNLNLKPFDKVEVRQAVNMAIDKERLAKILNNRAVPATQVLPPAMGGYDPAYKGYPHDIEQAKALLAKAGLADGFTTQLYFQNADPWPRLAQAIQQDLAAVGIKAELKGLDLATSVGVSSKPDGAPMSLTEWYADFPDPSNFYTAILGCAGAIEGGYNWSFYCNKEIDARAAAADSMADPAKATERLEAWKGIYADIMKDAPWVPLVNARRYALKSSKIDGDPSYFQDIITQPFPYDAVWVKQ
jgi:ABC-type transport system substrate-binding protein